MLGALSTLYRQRSTPDFRGVGMVFAPRARDRHGAMQRPTMIGMSTESKVAPSWREYYLQYEWYKIDPVYQACLQTTLPVWWGYDTKPNLIVGLGKTSSAMQINLFNRCVQEVGVRSGVSVPVHSALGGFGYIVYSSYLPIQDLMERNKRYEDQLLALSHRCMAAMLKEISPTESASEPLSERENECLSLAAHGKTLDEIATIMALSERTVRFHMGKVCEKLGAVNRVHAIARASYLGLLGPVH